MLLQKQNQECWSNGLKLKYPGVEYCPIKPHSQCSSSLVPQNSGNNYFELVLMLSYRQITYQPYMADLFFTHQRIRFPFPITNLCIINYNSNR